MTLITFQDGKVVMRDGKVGTEQGCCCGCATDEDCTTQCCVYVWQAYSPVDPVTFECTGVCADGYTLIDGCICDPTDLPFISTYFPCDGPVPPEVTEGLADPRGQAGGFGFGFQRTAFCCDGECLCECPPP